MNLINELNSIFVPSISPRLDNNVFFIFMRNVAFTHVRLILSQPSFNTFPFDYTKYIKRVKLSALMPRRYNRQLIMKEFEDALFNLYKDSSDTKLIFKRRIVLFIKNTSSDFGSTNKINLIYHEKLPYFKTLRRDVTVSIEPNNILNMKSQYLGIEKMLNDPIIYVFLYSLYYSDYIRYIESNYPLL
jgi:hypothetical protein